MIKKHLAVVILPLGLVVLGLLLVFAIPALANFLTVATATADCNGFSLSFTEIDLNTSTTYTVKYTFTIMCDGVTTTVPGSVTFMPSASTFTETATGTWPKALSGNCTVTGSATLTSSGSTLPITINGSATGVSLSCLGERMTGGGSVFIDPSTSNMKVDINGGTDLTTRVTHGFEIHCGNPPDKPNTLEVNWPGHHFHMDTLTIGTCVCDATDLAPENPDAGFNEFVGLGTGKLDGVDGATIMFNFTDQGEPGTNDTESMTILPSGSTTPALSFPETPLTFGNQQAHRDGGAKVPPCKP